MDLTGLTKQLALPAGTEVPRTLADGPVRAHAITRDDLDDDVRGINASRELIRRTRGGAWPGEPVTHEGNYVDLVWHEAEWRDNSSFTYVLTATGHGYIGCLYLYPLGRRSPLTEELLRHDVDISWWVTPSAYAAGLYRHTHQAVARWVACHDLPFCAPHYSNAEMPRP